MDDKEFNEEKNIELETLDETKEINTLKDLSRTALNQIVDEYQEEFDDGMDDADLIFKAVVDTKEEIKKEQESDPIEEEKKEEKKSWWKNLKSKWQALDKKKKIAIIAGIVIVVLVLIALIVYFVFFNSKEPTVVDEPNVVIEMDNYRYENGSLIFTNANDEEIGRYECENKDEDLCKMASLTDDDEFMGAKRVDKDGNPLQLNTSIYFNRYVFIVDHANETDQSISLYDLQNGEKITTVFSVKAYEEYENYVVVKNEESKYGVLQFTENSVDTIIPYSYDYVGLLPNQDTLEKIVVRDRNNSYLANLENVVLTKAITDSIVMATDSHIVTKDSANHYHVYDYNVTLLNDGEYDYIVPLDNLMIYVVNKELYVSDYEGNPMILEPIALNNTDYDPIETYENYKLVSTSRSFTVEQTNNLLNINVYDGDKYENHAIDLLEGELSKTLSFMNYFDGTLYFYSDEEKTSLIGSYKCSNENTLDASNLSLNSCRVASESFYRETTGNTKETDLSELVGWIPIINRQFVFVLDGDAIKLYDLINNKEIAPYKNVDTSSYTNVDNVTFRSTNELYFIAQSNTRDNYGVAKITSNGVEPVIPFEYQSIKWLGDYFVSQNASGYALYDTENQKLTSDKNSPIVDYLEVDSTHKYLKTYKDNMYFVHTYDKEISSNSYNYVALYNEFYAVVLNSRVHLYRYDDEKENKTEYIYESDGEEKTDGIRLNMNTYYGGTVNAFDISFTNTTITVRIGNTNNTYTTAGTFPKVVETGEENNES